MSLTTQPFNSLSSSLILGVTVCRNQGTGNKLLGQAGYALTSIVAIIETIAASILCVLTSPLRLFSSSENEPSLNKILVWRASSFFSIKWSFVYWCINIDHDQLAADELTARRNFTNGEYSNCPSGSIIHIVGHNFL